MGGQGVLDVFEGGENILLITVEGLALALVLHLDVGADAAGVEEVPGDAGRDVPEAAAPIGEMAELFALQAQGGGDGELGIEVGGRDADAGAGGGELALGAADIGAAAEQLGGEAGRDLGRALGDRLDLLQLGDEGPRLAAEEDAQAVAGLVALGLERGDLGLGAGNLSLGAGDVELAAAGQPGLGLRDLGGVLLDLDVALGDLDLLLEAAELEVISRDFSEERDQGVAAAFDLCGDVGVGGLDVAADAAEDVDFPRGVEAGLEKVGGGAGGGEGRRRCYPRTPLLNRARPEPLKLKAFSLVRLRR